MIILISSKITQSNIQASLGKAEYSYFFLLKEFMPALQQVAEVISVESTDQVDNLYQKYRAAGEQVVFISLSSPQKTPIGLACPTVCLFAWEYDNVPDEPWEGEPRNDWRYVLRGIAGAIACSRESADAVRKAMGSAYSVTAIPAPVWSHFQALMPENGWLPCKSGRVIEFSGHVFDSRVLGLSANGLVQHMPRPQPLVLSAAPKSDVSQPRRTRIIFRAWREAIHNRPSAVARRDKPVEPPHSEVGAQPLQACRVELAGVVFTSVLNPRDGRKNWIDIVTAFCWAFRDIADATLILKMTHHDLENYRILLLTILSRLSPFKCRVLVLHGFLDDQQYRDLINVSDYYVNASTCEGLCLPLMEFLSSGKPALAPRHTAMLDYLDEQMAYVVKASAEPSSWAHDPSGAFRTRKYRLNWQSLMEGYRECYRVANNDVESYQHMSRHAWQQLREYSDTPVVTAKLQSFLQGLAIGIEQPLVGASR